MPTGDLLRLGVARLTPQQVADMALWRGATRPRPKNTTLKFANCWRTDMFKNPIRKYNWLQELLDAAWAARLQGGRV
jgi:hypothetical protein